MCREEPGQLPERGLPGRGPAYLEGNSSWAWLPAQGLRVLGHERAPGALPASSSRVAYLLGLPQTQLCPARPVSVGQREMKQKQLLADWQEGTGPSPI